MTLNVTQNDATATRTSSEGFLLLDSSMSPILISAAAAQILSYPQKPETQRNLVSYLGGRIRVTLFVERSSAAPVLVPRFQSGRRTYLCRGFPVSGVTNAHAQGSLAVILARASASSTSLVLLSERFRLTARELEVARHLLEGLTSKEIGIRMQISPNTVKAFLRLIMMKMGVSTRSGVVGKALTTVP